MQYRKFGTLDWNASVLGFGAMRLPTVDEDPRSENIDEAEAINMIRTSIDQGINYIDTAYPYHNGNSEIVVGKALQDGYRQKVMLATKSPVRNMTDPADFDRKLAEQLKRLQTDHIDFYLLHGLGKHTWRNVVLKLGLLEKAEAALKDGRIRHLGFSFHDEYDAFQEIIDGYDKWEFCQIQYNYMDVETQAGTKGLKYAAAKGLAIVVMEPLLGGKLANPPADILQMLNQHDNISPADWALQWVWNHPEVTVVLSGMSTMEQVNQNIASAKKARANSLPPAHVELLNNVRETYLAKAAIPCTTCNYCMPCPNNVDIPKNFKMYNDGVIHNDPKSSAYFYKIFLREESRASSCVQCKICEEKCPQKIPISDWMPKVHHTLGKV